MKQLKQKLAYLLVIAMVFGMILPSATVVKAATTPLAVTINYGDETIFVTNASKPVYYSDKYDSAKADKTVWERAVVNSSGYYSIDYSWLKSTAESKLYIKTNGEVSTITFKAADKNLKAYYTGTSTYKPSKSAAGVECVSGNSIGNPENGYILFQSENKNVSPTDIEVRKGSTGAWRDLINGNNSTIDIAQYLAKGATLYFRIGSKSTESLTGSSITASGRSGKEVKVTVPKQASAPKITIDGTRSTLSLKKGQEYLVLNASGESISAANPYIAWIDAYETHKDGTKLNPVSLYDLKVADASGNAIDITNVNDKYTSLDGYRVAVRTAASGTKVASKVTEIKLEATSKASVVASGDALKVGYKKAYDKTSGLSFTNTTTTAFQVAVIEANGEMGNFVTAGGIGVDQDKLMEKINELNALKKISWTTVAAKKTKDVTATIPVSKYMTKDGKVYKDSVKSPIVIYRLATVKDDSKTKDTNEFRVASDVEIMTFASGSSVTAKLPDTITQSVAVSAVSKDGITVVAATNGALAEVTVVADQSKAITYEVDVTAADLTADATMTVTCVTASDGAVTTTPPAKGSSKVSVKAAAKISKTTGGKIKITLPAGMEESTAPSYWKLKVEGAETVIKLNIKKDPVIKTIKVTEGITNLASGTAVTTASAVSNIDTKYTVSNVAFSGAGYDNGTLKTGEFSMTVTLQAASGYKFTSDTAFDKTVKGFEKGTLSADGSSLTITKKYTVK